MRFRKRIGIPMVVAILVASCANVVPSPSADRASVSPGPPSVDTSSTPEPSARATASTDSSPSATPSPVASVAPPYRIELGDAVVTQEPGTIIFGSLPGGLSADFLEPYLTWPEEGLTIDAEVAFGAFWGRPLGASEIRITLYRVVAGGTLGLVWSDTKNVAPESVAYLDELVPFEAPGTYRLEVTRGSTLLAWGVAHMGPRCVTNCLGG